MVKSGIIMLVEVISTMGDISSLPVKYLNFLELKRIFFTSVFVYKPTKSLFRIDLNRLFALTMIVMVRVMPIIFILMMLPPIIKFIYSFMDTLFGSVLSFIVLTMNKTLLIFLGLTFCIVFIEVISIIIITIS